MLPQYQSNVNGNLPIIEGKSFNTADFPPLPVLFTINCISCDNSMLTTFRDAWVKPLPPAERNQSSWKENVRFVWFYVAMTGIDIAPMICAKILPTSFLSRHPAQQWISEALALTLYVWIPHRSPNKEVALRLILISQCPRWSVSVPRGCGQAALARCLKSKRVLFR